MPNGSGWIHEYAGFLEHFSGESSIRTFTKHDIQFNKHDVFIYEQVRGTLRTLLHVALLHGQYQEQCVCIGNYFVYRVRKIPLRIDFKTVT